MIMKKFLAMLLALTMLVAFAGCEEKPAEETLPEGVMTHAEFDAAALDAEVTVHTYVQAVESWWNGACHIYAQSKDGAYYIYGYECTEEEAAKAPECTKFTKAPVAKTTYKFTMAVSPLDCMGCTLCVKACPVTANAAKTGKAPAIEMKPIATQLDQQPAYDYAVAKVSEKPELINVTVKGSQFKQPLLEYSGSCAGCAETSYARLITQLFGERMYISNATGCSSIWGGSAPATPYTVNKESGRGPAWANSLFEDNAEHGLGIALGQKTIREKLIGKVAAMAESDKASDDFKAAAKAYLDSKDDGKANEAATKALVAALEACTCTSELKDKILAEKTYSSSEIFLAISSSLSSSSLMSPKISSIRSSKVTMP